LRPHWLEVREPCADDREEAIPAQTVMTAASLVSHLDQARLFQHFEVAGGGRPRMLEARGEIPRWQLSAPLREQDEDVTARLVSERGEDRVDVRKRRSLHPRE